MELDRVRHEYTLGTAWVVIAGVAAITICIVTGQRAADTYILIGFLTAYLYRQEHSKRQVAEVAVRAAETAAEGVKQTVKQANEEQRTEIRHDMRNELNPVVNTLGVVEKRTNGELDAKIVAAINIAAKAAVSELWEREKSVPCQRPGCPNCTKDQ